MIRQGLLSTAHRPRIMRRWQVGVAAVTLAAFALRLPGLFANTFHPDEALFASWARLIAVWRDPLLISQVVDKPPLLFYTQAIFYPLQGAVDWAARLPNFIAFLLLPPLTGVWAWRLFRDGATAVTAAAIVTFSPLAIQFSATAFTDPLLTTLLVGASLAVCQPRSSDNTGRFVGAGMWFGLALATKYQAVLFLPLIVGLGWQHGWRRREWQRWGLGLAPFLLALLVWDVARTGTFGLWSAQMGNYGGVRLAFSWELWPRLLDWGRLGQYVLGWGWVGITAVVVLGLWDHRIIGLSGTRLFLAGYFLLHWLLAVPVWDRYLLPILPLLALLLGRNAITLIRHSPLATRYLLYSLLLLALILPAWSARNGRYPIGGFPEADNGAAAIAHELQDAPYGTVLYDHWYSWQWRYHFFDKGVYVSWFPHPAALQEDLQAFGRDGSPRFIVLPQTAAALPVKRAIDEIGFSLEPIAESGNMELYRIMGSPADSYR